mgnify:CR=1 FL=1
MSDRENGSVCLPDGVPSLRVVPMPYDANHNGDIFGGWIMSQVDVAGGVEASRRAQGRVVTVAVESFVFKQPVRIGDVVSFYARIIETGRTSMKVDVSVYVERSQTGYEVVKVTEAVLSYVAINQQGEKRLVPAAK